MLDDDLGIGKPNDSDARIVVAAARRITGKQEAMKRNGLVLKVAAGVLLILASSAIGWLSRTTWSAVKSEVTADVVHDVGTLKTDVGTLKTDVGALKADVGAQGRRQKADGKVTRQIARKLKLELAPEPAEP